VSSSGRDVEAEDRDANAAGEPPKKRRRRGGVSCTGTCTLFQLDLESSLVDVAQNASG
jgi:hypothetical protein